MKSIFTLVLLSATLPQAPALPQKGPGLQILSLDVTEAVVKQDEWRESMVSNKAQELHPNLGRGDSEREATDSADVVSQKEVRKNMDQREIDLRKSTPPSPTRTMSYPVYKTTAQMKNDSSESIVRFVWAYKSSQELPYDHDQEFLCNVEIRPGVTRLVKTISRRPSQRVVSASASGTNTGLPKPALKDMVINKVEFADGSTWQRPDWNPVILSRQGARKIGKGKCGVL
jgi:enoyl reductase-like protein